ncbi:MAG: hypothetical protein MHM6MM_005748 [Cercozoa sp. M6MM]
MLVARQAIRTLQRYNLKKLQLRSLSMSRQQLLAVSAVDGRYASKTAALSQHVSEFALIRNRVRVEVEWLLLMAETPDFAEVNELSEEQRTQLRELVSKFDVNDALAVKAIEAKTNHDVKAVEYWLKQQLDSLELSHVGEFVHFACTSEDISNLAYSMMLQRVREEVLLPRLDGVLATLCALASKHAELPLMARTHGQPASPTTFGKEFANFAVRLARQRRRIARVPLMGKFSGAVGNYNAHVVAYPDTEWVALSRTLVEERLGLVHNPYTTQIESHDSVAEVCDGVCAANNVLLDLCRDAWLYVSVGVLKQKVKAGEVGSSTMPHKVNPIDFENAEGNLGVATASLRHLSDKLPISRWQRDLSDSTVMRTLGESFGHVLVALASLEKGLSRVDVDEEACREELQRHWELLAEPVQTVMRRRGHDTPYERLKSLTRGKTVNAEAMRDFIAGTSLGQEDSARLCNLTPADYVGLAPRLAKETVATVRHIIADHCDGRGDAWTQLYHDALRVL